MDIPTVSVTKDDRQSKEFSPDNDQNYWAKIFGGSAPIRKSSQILIDSRQEFLAIEINHKILKHFFVILFCT